MYVLVLFPADGRCGWDARMFSSVWQLWANGVWSFHETAGWGLIEPNPDLVYLPALIDQDETTRNTQWASDIPLHVPILFGLLVREAIRRLSRFGYMISMTSASYASFARNAKDNIYW